MEVWFRASNDCGDGMLIESSRPGCIVLQQGVNSTSAVSISIYDGSLRWKYVYQVPVWLPCVGVTRR